MADVKEVLVPDLGQFKDVPVIEVMVKPGDSVRAEDALVTLESDKATMDIPAPFPGVIKAVTVRVGDKLSSGTLVALVESSAAVAAGVERPALTALDSPSTDRPEVASAAADATTTERPPAPAPKTVAAPAQLVAADAAGAAPPHASPAVRRVARELGADLTKIAGSGPKGRILKEDVQAYVKAALDKLAQGGRWGFAWPEAPAVDFAAFGPVEVQPLSRIKKLSGTNLHRNWVSIPHVTQHLEADITDLEAFRQSLQAAAAQRQVKLTLLPLVMKAVVAALQAFPQFNASLEEGGERLVLKRYFHIGVAVDTPDGLVVPVVRDVGRKGVWAIAAELAELSNRARAKKLTLAEMQGGSFSISSLGGIGGSFFTPIINAPEVAILGVGRAETKACWHDHDQSVRPRLVLPLSLSYDHRVIDGAEGARFISALAQILADLRRTLL